MGSSIGGIVGGLFGGSTPSAPNVSTFQPTGTSAFDTSTQNLINSRLANNPYTQYAPQATATFNQQYNNPNAAGYQSAANAAGAQYGATGAADTAAAGSLNNSGNTATTASNQLLQMGYDPQNALKNQSQQQLNDQVNANLAATGNTSSPYGSSVSATANQNFNTDWQNQQLTRAIQALGGYTSGISGADADFAGANTLGTAGAANTAKAGAVPFAASTDITNSQNAALTSLMGILGNSGAGAFDQSTLSDLMSYLNLGAGQANQQGNFDLQDYQDQLAASQASQSGLGSLASSISNLAGGSDGAGYSMLLSSLIG